MNYVKLYITRLPAAHGSDTFFHAGNHRGLQDTCLRTGLSSSPCSAGRYAGRNVQTPVPDGKVGQH